MSGTLRRPPSPGRSAQKDGQFQRIICQNVLFAKANLSLIVVRESFLSLIGGGCYGVILKIRLETQIHKKKLYRLRELESYILGIVQKVFSPEGVPRIFDAFWTQF